MKKIYMAVLAVLAAAALNSCVQEKSFSDVKVGENGIVFSMKGASTRAADGVVPVVAPLIHDGEGNLLNTNADTIASKVAAGLAAAGYAVTLTFCFEKPGVLSDPSDDSSVIPVIDPAGFERLLAEGTVSGGMVPKLTGAFSSLKAGVAEVVITSASALRGGTRIIP